MNFFLRAWQQSDIKSIVKYANNEKIAANLRDIFPFPYTEADAEDYVNDCIQKGTDRQLTLAIVIDNEAVGSIGVFLQSGAYVKTAELGYWLGEPFWGQGIITAAIKEICTAAFNRYDIVRIFAQPFVSNIASCRALEKAGFELEGVMKKSVFKNGRMLDSCLYALLREEESD